MQQIEPLQLGFRVVPKDLTEGSIGQVSHASGLPNLLLQAFSQGHRALEGFSDQRQPVLQGGGCG